MCCHKIYNIASYQFDSIHQVFSIRNKRLFMFRPRSSSQHQTHQNQEKFRNTSKLSNSTKLDTNYPSAAHNQQGSSPDPRHFRDVESSTFNFHYAKKQIPKLNLLCSFTNSENIQHQSTCKDIFH